MLPGAPKGRVCAQGKAGGGFPVFVEINIIRLSPTTHLLLTRELEEPQRPGDGGGGENGKKRLQVLKGSVLVPHVLQIQSAPCNKVNAIQGTSALQGLGLQEEDTDEVP